MNAARTTSRPVLFYGVNAEGMGHATRSLPVIERLQRHYDVHVFCGARARRYFEGKLAHVHEVFAIKLIYENNRLKLWRTIFASLSMAHHLVASVFHLVWLILRHDPVAVVCDYEVTTAWAAMFTGCPLVSIDNQHIITFGRYHEPDTRSDRNARQVMRNSNFWNVPRKDRVLITSFFQPPLEPGAAERGVRYVPTTLRPQVLARLQRTRTDGPVLVYQTSSSNRELPGLLAAAHDATGLSFVLYGYETTEPMPAGVRLRPFSEDAFFDDLSSAPFVVVNGGHSTISEALALGKPVLAEPIGYQYEQWTNVVGLETLGVGRGTRKLTVADIAGFRDGLEVMTARARQMRHADTDGVVREVMNAVHEVAPGLAVAPQHGAAQMTAPEDGVIRATPGTGFSSADRATPA